MPDLQARASPLIKVLAPFLLIKIHRQDLAPTDDQIDATPHSCLISKYPCTLNLVSNCSYFLELIDASDKELNNTIFLGKIFRTDKQNLSIYSHVF